MDNDSYISIKVTFTDSGEFYTRLFRSAGDAAAFVSETVSKLGALGSGFDIRVEKPRGRTADALLGNRLTDLERAACVNGRPDDLLGVERDLEV